MALEQGLVSVVFQPILDLRSGETFAFEVLARCRAKGLENPMHLFETSVDQGLAGALGRRVRELAIGGCADYPLFLNVHPAEFSDRWLVQPDDPIFEHAPGIYLEITESVPMSHHELVKGVISEVRSKGVGLVVDDLGAGYSNLRYISDLAPDLVKVDRGLVMGLDGDRRRRTLLGALARLCNDLGAEVVAEGIETHAELDAVRDCGVRFVQGYLIARPGSAQPTSLDTGGSPASRHRNQAVRRRTRTSFKPPR